MEQSTLRQWLRETDGERLRALWRRADDLRRAAVGDAVHLRGLLEASSYCGRRCGYCGLRAPNGSAKRYRMSHDEVLVAVRGAMELGYGTIVLQSGEDFGLTTEWVAELIRGIKAEGDLAVTLSLGERDDRELALWRAAGADRYLLRFETSNRALFEQIHPSLPGKVSDRIAILEKLRVLGYEVGSGVMIGIPGQSYDDLARDIELFGELELDMIGVGPFIAHPETPLGGGEGPQPLADGEQVPADELTTYKVLALTRLIRPASNIPSTTALATINKTDGRVLGLQRGANVVMPNITPAVYRDLYEIYPEKACANETAEHGGLDLRAQLESIGRFVGTGRGDSPSFRTRTGAFAAAGEDSDR